jgi:hypothetical protein
MKPIRNKEIHRLIERHRNDFRRELNREYGSHYLKNTYERYMEVFSSYLPNYCENIQRFHWSGDTLLACQLFEGQMLDAKPIWFVSNLLATHHPYAIIQYSELAEKVNEIYAKREYRGRCQTTDIHFDNGRRTLRLYMNKVARKMAEMSDDLRFIHYTDKFFYTQDVKEFRFRLSTHGADHYRFAFDFIKYEYEFSEKHNGFLFTRRIDKGKDEAVCFIAQLSGYYREAKLLKGIYNRETKEFTPKNINYIKKRLKQS